jgi:hypothetical protein
MRSAFAFAAGLAAMLAAGWLLFPKALYRAERQPLQFSHKAHSDKAGLECSGCHAIGEDGRFAGIPALDNCAGCHSAPQGETANEKRLVADYVTPNREIPWKAYWRQPVNVRFSHARHVNAAKMACETCHGSHGKTDSLPPYEQNRISGYSRKIWGSRMTRIGLQPGDGMKMSDCERCHEEKGVQAGCLGCHQ